MALFDNEAGGILKFSSKVDNLVCMVKLLGQQTYLNHLDLVEVLINKMDLNLKRRWVNYFAIQKSGFYLEKFAVILVTEADKEFTNEC